MRRGLAREEDIRCIAGCGLWRSRTCFARGVGLQLARVGIRIGFSNIAVTPIEEEGVADDEELYPGHERTAA